MASELHVRLDGLTWLVVETILERVEGVEGVEPADTLRWFVEPNLLARWWGEEHAIDPAPGRRYEVSWPGMNWTMRGQILTCNHTQLVYSWTWDHEPDVPARTVIVRCYAWCELRCDAIDDLAWSKSPGIGDVLA